MSLVLGYADGQHAIIMSDGRATGSHPSEEKNKTEKINDNIILGYVGFEEDAKIFINFTHDAFGDYQKDIGISEFLEYVSYQIDNEDARKYMQSTFMIIGRDVDGSMVFAEIGHYTGHKVLGLVVGDRPYGKHIGGTIDRGLIDNIFDAKMQVANADNAIGLMMEVIYAVADIDSSVNKNCFCLVI